VRVLGLKLALSAKAAGASILVIDSASTDVAKTKALREKLTALGLTNALIVDGAEPQEAFRLAARAIPDVDVLPIQGINVYDILRRDTLVLTKAAVSALEERFK
jgi:large subunit ribosomal protein L4